MMKPLELPPVLQGAPQQQTQQMRDYMTRIVMELNREVGTAGAGRAQAVGIGSPGPPGPPGPQGPPGEPGGGTTFTPDETLSLTNGVLSVNRATEVEEDNTLPITAAAVHTTVGNIEILLSTI